MNRVYEFNVVKWKSFFPLLLVLSVSFVSCSLQRKSFQTIQTITKIDTIIRIVKDTVVKTKESLITDTVFIENEVARAKSFVNKATGTLVIQLQGKPFEVPVIAERKVTATNKEITKKNNTVWYCIIQFLIIVILILLLKFSK